MSHSRRLWTAGVLLVAVGWLVTPSAVPIYDGVGVPDEPYRYVAAPAGHHQNGAPTTGSASTPVAQGIGTNGLILATSEQSPQLSIFVPPGALAVRSGPIVVLAAPQAPTDQPVGSRIGGNVYLVTFTSRGGPVTTTVKLGIASIYLRAPDGSDGWLMQYRPGPGPWATLETSRGGTDSFVSSFKGAGDYALAKPAEAKTTRGSGPPLLAWLLGGAVALLVLLVLTIRLRATPE